MLIDRGMWPLGVYRATSKDNVTRAVLGALAKLVKLPVKWPRAERARVMVRQHDGSEVPEYV